MIKSNAGSSKQPNVSQGTGVAGRLPITPPLGAGKRQFERSQTTAVGRGLGGAAPTPRESLGEQSRKKALGAPPLPFQKPKRSLSATQRSDGVSVVLGRASISAPSPQPTLFERSQTRRTNNSDQMGGILNSASGATTVVRTGVGIKTVIKQQPGSQVFNERGTAPSVPRPESKKMNLERPSSGGAAAPQGKGISEAGRSQRTGEAFRRLVSGNEALTSVPHPHEGKGMPAAGRIQRTGEALRRLVSGNEALTSEVSPPHAQGKRIDLNQKVEDGKNTKAVLQGKRPTPRVGRQDRNQTSEGVAQALKLLSPVPFPSRLPGKQPAASDYTSVLQRTMQQRKEITGKPTDKSTGKSVTNRSR